MPDIPLLQPAVLNGVIERFTAPENLLGRAQLMGGDRHYPNPDPVVAYDIVQGNRTRAVPNIPNTEAHVIQQLGVGHIAASMIYMRDKKVFSPTTIRWLRAPGELAAKNAEQAVMRELTDMNNRFERFAEFCIWQAFTTGALVFAGGGVVININYLFTPTHLPVVAVAWGAAGADILSDIRAWKRLISRDGQAVATDCYLNEIAMEAVARDPGLIELFTEEKKNQLLNTGYVTGLVGLTWHVYDIAYVDDNGVVTQYIADDRFVLLSNDNPDRWYFYEGPSADMAAPENHIGKFSKTWEVEDPSARQYLMEWHFLPAIWRPDQIVAADITP